jgi:hypothetical protein
LLRSHLSEAQQSIDAVIAQTVEQPKRELAPLSSPLDKPTPTLTVLAAGEVVLDVLGSRRTTGGEHCDPCESSVQQERLS